MNAEEKEKNSASSALIRVQLKRKQLSNGTRTSRMNAEEKEKNSARFAVSVYPRPIKEEAIIKWDADEQDERGEREKKKNSAYSAFIRVQLKRKQLSSGTRASRMNAEKEKRKKTPRIQRLSASN